ncbi:MAG: carboxylating nicotinate-nucleotide diphosphorylase [Xanthomonadales bacterium]|nr:carboxylating nicotinate-nucleotide diphosphorylase [Xanthomonadales bacterium]
MNATSSPIADPDAESIRNDVGRALAEDMGSGDVTADLLPESRYATARVVTREAAILCGQKWFDDCFKALDSRVSVSWLVNEGSAVRAGETLCEISGPVRALVTGERSALNFLQTLSATATVTAAYVNAIRGTRASILDTRKTLPGMRRAQKYAVRVGGGKNHRMGLHDAILIKENHIAAAGSIGAAVARARLLHPEIMVEVEVEDFSELREALEAGVDRIMLDEFELDELMQAVVEVDGRVPLEVSGGVGIDRVRAIAETGVDYISIGALTKHIHAIDLSMRIVLE